MDETANISRIENLKAAVANKLAEAAHIIRKESASAGSEEGLGHYGLRTSDFLEKSSDYVRNFDAEKFGKQVVQQVQRNPGRSLAVAASAGFIIGILIRRR